MTIVGVGVDVVDVARFERVLARTPRLADRLFTPDERERPIASLAARFAAKEAAMKALGTGHTQEVLWRSVEVVRHGGPPRLLLHGGAARRFEAMGGGTSLLTITHSETVALAQVLLLGR